MFSKIKEFFGVGGVQKEISVNVGVSIPYESLEEAYLRRSTIDKSKNVDVMKLVIEFENALGQLDISPSHRDELRQLIQDVKGDLEDK